jgi:hypothetical protein
MAKINKETKREASTEVNGVLVDAIDHGTVETPWGTLPRYTLRFEIDRLDASGKPITVDRTFNNYRYPKTALTLSVKSWLGIDLSENESVDLQDHIGTVAKLGCDERASQSGKKYLNVLDIKPAGEVKLKPSGNYEREVEI